MNIKFKKLNNAIIKCRKCPRLIKFSKKFAHNKAKQIKELKKFIIKWNGKGNLIFVTHYVVISEVLNLSVSSGEIVIADKDFNILARQKTSNN